MSEGRVGYPRGVSEQAAVPRGALEPPWWERSIPFSAVVGLVTFGSLALGAALWMPADALVADETFYVLQARRLREGSLLWMDATSSTTWPLVLVPFAGAAWSARLAACAVAGLAAALGVHWMRPRLGRWTAALVVLLVLSCAPASQPLAAAYSDGWGALLLLAWLTLRSRGGSASSWWVGAPWLGLAFSSRLSFVSLAPALWVALLPRHPSADRGEVARRTLEIGGGVALALAVAQLVGNQLLGEKLALPPPSVLLDRLASLPSYAGWPLLVLGSLGLVELARDHAAFRRLPLAALIALATELPNRMWQERYHFPVLVLLALGAGAWIARQLLRDRWVGGVALAMLAVAAAPRLTRPFLPDANRYLLALSGCVEVRRLESSCDGSVALPFMTQARGSTCTYRGEVSLPRGAARVFGAYLDDRAALFVGEREVGRTHALAPLEGELALGPGRHPLRLEIENDVAFGGVGQLLFCGGGPILDAEEQRVRAAFLVLLGREPDPGGLATYARALRAGTSTLELCRILLASEEHRARGAPPVALIEEGLRLARGAEPADAERAAALARVARGELTEVLAELVDEHAAQWTVPSPGAAP